MASLQVASAGWLPARWLPQTGRLDSRGGFYCFCQESTLGHSLCRATICYIVILFSGFREVASAWIPRWNCLSLAKCRAAPPRIRMELGRNHAKGGRRARPKAVIPPACSEWQILFYVRKGWTAAL